MKNIHTLLNYMLESINICYSIFIDYEFLNFPWNVFIFKAIKIYAFMGCHLIITTYIKGYPLSSYWFVLSYWFILIKIYYMCPSFMLGEFVKKYCPVCIVLFPAWTTSSTVLPKREAALITPLPPCALFT